MQKEKTEQRIRRFQVSKINEIILFASWQKMLNLILDALKQMNNF